MGYERRVHTFEQEDVGLHKGEENEFDEERRYAEYLRRGTGWDAPVYMKSFHPSKDTCGPRVGVSQEDLQGLGDKKVEGKESRKMKEEVPSMVMEERGTGKVARKKSGWGLEKEIEWGVDFGIISWGAREVNGGGEEWGKGAGDERNGGNREWRKAMAGMTNDGMGSSGETERWKPGRSGKQRSAFSGGREKLGNGEWGESSRSEVRGWIGTGEGEKPKADGQAEAMDWKCAWAELNEREGNCGNGARWN
ncbi:unnamed protein product [Calypogeia fissa]